MRKVVITGIGAITPLANTFADSWDAVKNGLSGIKRISKFNPLDMPWQMAGEIDHFNPDTYLPCKDSLRLDPFVQYAAAAALMAAGDAGFTNGPSSEKKMPNASPVDHRTLVRTAVIIGSSRGGISTIERECARLFEKGHVSPFLMPSTTISMAASYAAQRLGVKGNCLGISNACASGANAIGEAFRMIRHGLADVAFAGGAEAPVCRLCIEGYGIAGALSETDSPAASRPFDSARDGFVIAEGAAVLVLEELSSAQKRNAKIYGEIIGYGSTTDAFHVTKPDPEGEARAISEALKDAGVSPEEVEYINAHGTSTVLGDRAEAEAIQKAFKGRDIPVSSTKSSTGHMLAASGAFEVACTLMSIKEGIIPPTMNVTEKDPACAINVVTMQQELPIGIALSHSFGFGGVNAVLVLKRYSAKDNLQFNSITL